jgi:hypothetical protein
MKWLTDLLDELKNGAAEGEEFTPKNGNDPAKEKWRDAKSSRKQYYWLYHWMTYYGCYENNWEAISENGIPITQNYRTKQMQYDVNGFDRPRSIRYYKKRNGSVPFQGNGDPWSKPNFEKKGGRVHNRLKEQWKNDANETLYCLDE